MRRYAIAAVFLLVATATAPAGAQAPEVASGIQKVQEGDFEGAVLDLNAAARTLEGRPERKRDLVQAYVYLGVAHVALEQPEQAQRSFTEALARDPKLRLSAQMFPPKVLAAFEDARRKARAGRGGGSRAGWIAGGAAAGAAAAAVIASSGDGAKAPSVVNARMATPVIECPNGSDERPIGFGLLVDVRNRGGRALPVTSVTMVAVIVASPAIPSEVGLASNRPAVAVPSTIPAGTDSTLRVDSTMLCGNGPEDAFRYNEWSVRLTLTTSAGVFTIEAADRLRVNIP